MSSELSSRISSILEELKQAAPAGKAPLLVAVSKTVDSSSVHRAYEAGLRDFGENRVQELLRKIEECSDLDGIRWHFIGRLQRNKVRKILGRVALIHSVDSTRLAEAINRTAIETGNAPCPVLLEVNVSCEESKAGFSPDEIPRTLESLLKLEGLSIRGFMTMAPFIDDQTLLASYFRNLAELSARMTAEFGPDKVGGELSMGMSNDYLTATKNGATMVRIGSRIFHGG